MLRSYCDKSTNLATIRPLYTVYIKYYLQDLCSEETCQRMYDRILDELPELRSPASVSYTITEVPPNGPQSGIEDLRNNLQKMA